MKNLKNALLLKQLYQLKQLGYQYTSVIPYKEDEPNFTLPNSLNTLKDKAKECHLCTLSKTRQKVIFGEGNPHADIMFIGDTPSSSDESVGKIFTGRSGEMLTKMIENVLKLQREDIYLTNILKCRSHENKDISPKHAHTCLPYLLKEIDLVKPKVILTLGESAYQYLTEDNTPLHDIRGSIQQKENYLVIPTHHPNFLLRNPSAKKDVLEDLLKIKDLV
ncbi:MAG: uracil-DNA glycosylase [Sulfurovum sp.]|nr:uracil-DNA glycosylase [Sulfurovum sp.]